MSASSPVAFAFAWLRECWRWAFLPSDPFDACFFLTKMKLQRVVLCPRMTLGCAAQYCWQSRCLDMYLAVAFVNLFLSFSSFSKVGA